MKLCIIGLGSMGKRRIRLLKQIDPSIELIGVDTSEERTKETQEKFNIRVYQSLDEALALVDGCLVCTAPITHAGIIRQCLLAKKHVFTELNLVSDGYEELIALAKANNCTLFLSSSMLYRKEISYITRTCANEENLTYSYHVGQYLPDWHPWESFHNFFVSNKRTNGCRELFAIELPWLLEAFGDIQSCKVLQAKKSNLAIDYPDTYQVLLEHENNNSGVIWIDVVCRVACRQLKVSSQTTHLTWNGTPDSLIHYVSDRDKWIPNTITLYDSVEKDNNYQTSVIENMYVDELLNFLGVMKKEEQPRYSFEKDAIVLQLIDSIEDIRDR